MNENKKVRSLKDLMDQRKEGRRKMISDKVDDSSELSVDLFRKLEDQAQHAMTFSIINFLITIGLLIMVFWMFFRLYPLLELLG